MGNKNENKLIFFTFNNFIKKGGDTIRMTGMINSVANTSSEIILISNIQDDEKKNFSKNIKHIKLNVNISIYEKRVLQFCLSVLPIFIVNILFKKKIKELENMFHKYNLNLNNREIIFLEYLDISVGYLSKKNNFIKEYICDIHGLVPNEFKQKKYNRIMNYVKYLSAVLLDRKVFSNSSGLIFASNAMKKYFYYKMPQIRNKKFVILPYFLSRESLQSSVDRKLLSSIKQKYSISSYEKIILFAGAFKYLGGVDDLVKSFIKVLKIENRTKLVLIGTGEGLDNIKNIIKENNLEGKIILVGTIPYSQLKTYQELANIIVCPDKENIYSNLILHLKYLDALASNKIVINGSFEAVREINIDEKLSINFQPSNINDLKKKILYSFENLNMLTTKYSGNNKYVSDNLLYENNPKILFNFTNETIGNPKLKQW